MLPTDQIVGSPDEFDVLFSEQVLIATFPSSEAKEADQQWDSAWIGKRSQPVIQQCAAALIRCKNMFVWRQWNRPGEMGLSQTCKICLDFATRPIRVRAESGTRLALNLTPRAINLCFSNLVSAVEVISVCCRYYVPSEKNRSGFAGRSLILWWRSSPTKFKPH